jgi:GH25 family lysozyme M1 (1,4-beta-N-acetylmuramidase)
MSTASGRRLASVLATAAVLAASGTAGAVAVLDTSGTGGLAPAPTSARGTGQSPAARAPAPPARHSLSLVAPVRNRPAGFAARAAAPATRAPGPAAGALPSATRALSSAISKPPPVADGIRRFNVGAAHSPQLLRELSGPLSTTGLPGTTRAPSGTSTPGRTITPGPGAAPAATDATVRGVDVASYQHPDGAAIDWARVARAGYKFAFIKATEGNYYTNPYYARDLAQAKAAGMYVTGYHFAVPNVSSGASQAKYAVDHGSYAANGRILPLALDIEYNPYGAECYGLTAAKMVSWISAFTSEVRNLTGQLPIIYTTANWWSTCTSHSTALGSDPLWVAAYGTGSPPLPAGWRNWTFWQYTSGGSVPGITGNVDVSYFNSALVRLLDPGSQRNTAGTTAHVQVNSLNAAAGRSLAYTASGLPAGLSISSSGLIAGTVPVAAAGTHDVTVTARNSSGVTGSVSFTWTVAAGGPVKGYDGKCVDDYGSGIANGTKIDLYTCNGTAAQQWALVPTPSGELVSPHSGKCLDDTASGGQGTKLELYTCTGGANQRWAHQANGEYVLRSNGLCLNDPGYLTANGTQLIIWACADTGNEHWSLPGQ